MSDTMFEDRILNCIDCGEDFVFSAGEQQFFADKHFVNDPKRCKTCKAKRTSGMITRGPVQRRETIAVCHQCGRQTTVPFRPTQGRPVYCRECFQEQKRMSFAATA